MLKVQLKELENFTILCQWMRIQFHANLSHQQQILHSLIWLIQCNTERFDQTAQKNEKHLIIFDFVFGNRTCFIEYFIDF